MSGGTPFPWAAYLTVCAFLLVVTLIDPTWGVIIAILALFAIAGGLGKLFTALGLQ